ncbi:PilZ domain-containing protein [Gynuella sp.]|uniref:PilZ domain-containing protein n=1 Tax=Gynuella sp. TaxID=2969146 RepID=UPI003D0B1E61
MRRYIRHPITVPLQYQFADDSDGLASRTSNISNGGLCINTEEPLPPGKHLKICIHIGDLPFEVDAQVVWCNTCLLGFESGVCFQNTEDAYAARMVEQICYIEQYRQRIREQEQRELTQEQAAEEWIERHAADFPSWDH